MDLKNTDQRLAAAYKRLDAGKVSILSIDIFDTLLWRKAPSPIEFYLMLGRQLKAEGWLIPAVTAECFAFLRLGAEQLARYHKVGGSGGTSVEVTLREIYWSLAGAFKKITIEQMAAGSKGIINESDVDDLLQFELELEKRCTGFDINILKLIYYASQNGVPVILTSDTAYETAQMAFLLDRPSPIDSVPFGSKISQIFLSCEEGVGKRHGLFSKILQTLNLAPKQLLHVGDILLTDITPAKKLGIATCFYPKYDTELQTVIQREWPALNPATCSQMLDSRQGDFGTTAMRSRICNHTDIKKLAESDAFYWKYGASILGPVMTAFVHWIYDRCAELGSPQIFCLMREGRLYANLIKEYAPYYSKGQLNPVELWVSRYFMFSLSVFSGDSKELLFLIDAIPVMRFTVKQFCNILGLDVSKLPKYAKYAHVKLDNKKFCEELCHYLSSDSSLREQIVLHSAARRKRFLKYLSSLVDLSNISHMVLGDVGWIGTTQGVLQSILFREGYNIKLHGLYLCTEERTAFPLLQGFIREGFLIKAGFPPDVLSVIKRALSILEMPALTELGVMMDIDENGEIITGDNPIPRQQFLKGRLVQQGIIAYCHELGKYTQMGSIALDPASEAFQEQLRQILKRATGDPTRLEARHLIEFSHDAASRKLGKAFITSKNRYYEKFVGDILPNMKEWKIAWPAAYAAKVNEYLPLTYQAVQMLTLPQQCFLSHETVALKIFVDAGKGFPKRATQVVHMHSNANRSFFGLIELPSTKKNIKALRFEIVSPLSLVRIKSLRLTLNRTGSLQLEQKVFFESGNGETEIKHLSVKKIDHNTFFCKDNLTFTHIFALEDVYAAQINLICEKFELTEDPF